MRIIHADQLVYTRVEPAFSPQGKSGFQTVYKSETLSANEVKTIEIHIQCFRPDQSDPVRRQFFALDSGKVVLANTIQIQTHPVITDKTRRGGAFIAHCLVLSQADFKRIDYNPFPIFNVFLFLNDAEDMVNTFGQATGKTEPVRIKVERLWDTPSSVWTGAEAAKLVALAMQAEQLLNMKQSILLEGSEASINEALQTAFFLMPKNNRLACTFNTFINGCPPQPGLYWALGTNTRQSNHSYIRINAAERCVVSQVENTLDDHDLYLTWLKQVSTYQNGDTIMKQAPTIQELAKAFTDRSQLNLTCLEEDACQLFMELHKKQVRQNLETILVKMAGENLTPLFVNYLIMATEPLILLKIATSQHLHPTDISHYLVDWIVTRKPNLKKKHLKDLRKLARRSGSVHLLYLSATLGNKSEAGVRDEALKAMDGETFEAALKQLLDPIPPVEFVTAAHLSRLLSDDRLENMSDEQFVDLVKAIINADASAHLGELTGYVKGLQSKPLGDLEKLIRKQSRVPPAFKQAVEARREELGPLRLLRF